MQIILNEQGFVTDYALIGSFGDGAIEVLEPENLNDFEANYRSYFVSNGKLVKDENKQFEIEDMLLLDDLRRQRAKECFPYINRGALWYNRLSEAQTQELQIWYQAWLNVTETKVTPQAPEWLNNI